MMSGIDVHLYVCTTQAFLEVIIGHVPHTQIDISELTSSLQASVTMGRVY